MSVPASVALIGLGEVGGLLAHDLKARSVLQLFGYDPKLRDPASPPTRNAEAFDVITCATAAGAAARAGMTISAVTAAQTERAAASAAQGLPKGAFYLDLNSASPNARQGAAEVIEAAGGRYVEAAVMSPIQPHGIASPMLLGGPHAQDFMEVARELDMRVTLVSHKLGVASATKLCRSVMIKGVEALVAESLLSARHYGVDAAVLASLANLLPNDNWEKLARYMFSRSLEHGARRAEEMREAARTVVEAGVEPIMSIATAARQDWAAEIAARLPPETLANESLAVLLDGVLAELQSGPGREAG